MNIIEAKNLCKTYIVDKRQNNVLRNVNLRVEKGEMVGSSLMEKISLNSAKMNYPN